MTPSELRALWRVEYRELTRHPGRSSLVAGLIAISVAAVMGGATLARIVTPTPEEQATRAMGRADLRIEYADYEALERVVEVLPEGVRTERAFLGADAVRANGKTLRARLLAAAPSSFRSDGRDMLQLEAGHAPTHSGEVALSPILLRGLDVSLGDTVALEFGPFRVVTGVVVDPEDRDAAVILRTPAAVEYRGTSLLLVETATTSGSSVQPDVRNGTARREVGDRTLRADATASTDIAGVARTLRALDGVAKVTTRSDAQEGDDGLATIVFALGLIGFLEAALVIASALSIGLGRRRHEIGLLGANGAPVASLAVCMVASAAALALVGSLVGVGLGVLGAAGVHPHLDGWNGRLNGPFEARVGDALIAALLGTVTAVLGALLPVLFAVRVPVREALGGARPRETPAHRWLGLGLALVGASLALLVFVPRGNAALGAIATIGGPLLGILGFGAMSPWLLTFLARRASRLGLTWRLAVRDGGRFRGRNGPVLTAIVAGMSMSVTVAVLVSSLEVALDRIPTTLRSDQLRIEGPGADEAVRRLRSSEVGIAEAAPLQAAYDHGQPLYVDWADSSSKEWIAVGDASLLHCLGVQDSVAASLAASGVVLRLQNKAGGSPARGGRGADFETTAVVTTGPTSGSSRASGGSLWQREGDESLAYAGLRMWLGDEILAKVPVRTVEVEENVREPRYFLHEDALANLGLESGPPIRSALVPWIARLEYPLTRDRLREAESIAATIPGTTIDARILYERPARRFYRWILGVSLVTGIVVVSLANALSLAESAGDVRTLRSVGASPRFLRSHVASRAAYLALLGCVLAVPAGLLPALALFRAANLPLGFVMVPWPWVLVTVFGLPALTYGGAWILAERMALTIRLPGVTAALAIALWLGALPGNAGGLSHDGARDGLNHERDGYERTATVTEALVSRRATHADGRIAETQIEWEPFVGRAFDGSPLDGELGKIRVPENHDVPEGRWIELSFVRYRTSHTDPGPPIFYLAGGPGGSGVELASLEATHPQIRLLEHADVIGLDQRGTGRSVPSFVADSSSICAFPYDRPLDRATVIQGLRAAVAKSLGTLEARGYDRRAYDTRQSAEDLESLRIALGAPKVVLWGTSYGSHLGLAYLRRHPESVERALLQKVEGPNDTFKRPAVTQSMLERLAEEVRDDPRVASRIPDLLALVRSLLERLGEAPVTAQTSSGDSIVLGAYDLQVYVARRLAETPERRELPQTLLDMEDGDWTDLADASYPDRWFEVPLLAVLMDCASGVTEERRIEIERETQDPSNLLGDALSAPLHLEILRTPGLLDLGDGFRQAFQCDVPVLFTSGVLDARTPPENVETLLPGFPNGIHVTVTQAGHESRELMSTEYRTIVQSFLRGEPVAGCVVELPRVLLLAGR